MRPLLDRFTRGFGFRKELIRGHSLLLVRGLGVSGSDRTYIGRNGWLFLAKETPKPGRRQALRYARNEVPLGDAESASIARGMEATRRWLASLGAHYVFVVAPNKETIYPDQLPWGFERARSASRLDQLLTSLRRDTQVLVIDLRPPLRKARTIADVYYKTDSHWNPLGALIAQEAIAGALRDRVPALRPLTVDDFDIVREWRPGGDLARILALQGDLREDAVLLRPRKPLTECGLEPEAVFEGRDIRASAELITQCDSAPLGRAVVQRDSFGEALVPFLAPHFRRTVYLWNRRSLDWERIRRERPDVVIHEVVERSLLDTMPLQQEPPP